MPVELLHRRHFLGAVAASVAAAASPLGAAPRRNWLRGVAANAFGLRAVLIADFGGTLRRLRRIGFEHLELVSFRGWDTHPYGSFSALAPLSGGEVASILRSAGVACNSSHVLHRELEAAAIDETLLWMEPIGVRTLILAGLPMPGEGNEAMIRALDGLNDTGCKLAKRGFRFMVHGDFALWRMYGDHRHFDEFVRRVDPSLCKLQLDLGATLQMSVDAAAIIRQNPEHIGSIHLRDGKPPFAPDVYVPSAALGDGDAPVPAIVRAALAAGISDFVVEMVMRPEGGEIDALARSMKYLEHLSWKAIGT